MYMVCMWGSPHHLVSQQQDGLEAEFAGAEVEEVLQTGPQQLHHHHVVVALRTAPLYGWDAHCDCKKQQEVPFISVERLRSVRMN